MTRTLLYLAIVFAAALGFVWLADRPGAVTLEWQGYEITTSLVVAAIAATLLVLLIAALLAILRAILTAPRRVKDFFSGRRRDRGYRALSRGLIAVGAGDFHVARRAARDSESLLTDEPLTLLLSAQTAQLAGNSEEARTAFEALATRPGTRVLGLHGLFIEARRQNEHVAARHFAEEATKSGGSVAWAGTALFDYQAQAGDWSGALATLAANTDAGFIDRERARRLRAVLLTAQALELEAGDPDQARSLALEAQRLAPDLSEAAVVAGRLLARAGDLKKASRTLEAAWKAAPHPDIADTYAALRPGDAVRDRLNRVRQLADFRANHPEGALAIARAAIDAHDWTAAREALEGPARSNPTERVCLLMADIEEGESGDEGRAREWLARAFYAPRDPAWVADGRIFPRWAPVSPVSGRIDAFEWKVPSESRPARRIPTIDDKPDPLVRAIVASRSTDEQDTQPTSASPAAEPNTKQMPQSPPTSEPLPAPPPPAVDRSVSKSPPRTVEPALPRPPDDPGPEPDEESNGFPPR